MAGIEFELRFFEGFPRARIRLYPADETWSQCATHFAEEYGYFRRRQKNMYKAFACDPVVIDDGDEGLLRYCVSEVSEVGAREALERYLKDQRWKAFSIRQIRAATPDCRLGALS
jgi:hypothetical protein